MAGANFSGAGNKTSKAVNSSFDRTFKKNSFAPKLCIDYFFTQKIGAGISYNHLEYNLHAESYAGSVYDPGGFFFFFYSSPGYVDHYNTVDINTGVHMFSAHASYKLTQYNRDRTQLFEITTHVGISVSSINEEQKLTVTQKIEDPNGYSYFEDRRAVYDFNKTAGSVFLNLQVALHVTRYFSFIMADLTQNFGIINPGIPQTSVTINDDKTVTAYRHKTTSSGFTICTGLSVTF